MVDLTWPHNHKNHIDVAVRNRPPTQRQTHNSIMTCWASSALSHFLLSEKKKQNKTDYRLKRRRETTVDLTLNIFNFPLDFLFFLFLLFPLTDCTLGAEKEKPSQPIFSAWTETKPICCWVFWTLNPVLNHVSHVKAYQVLVQIRARRRENQHAQCTDIPTCTHTYTHTKYILCTSTYTKT